MTYNKNEFLDWLEEIKRLLPPMMSIEDALNMYKTKLAQDEYIRANSFAKDKVPPVGKMTLAEKEEYYAKHILPLYDNDPYKVPPHLEPDWNEGWK